MRLLQREEAAGKGATSNFGSIVALMGASVHTREDHGLLNAIDVDRKACRAPNRSWHREQDH